MLAVGVNAAGPRDGVLRSVGCSVSPLVLSRIIGLLVRASCIRRKSYEMEQSFELLFELEEFARAQWIVLLGHATTRRNRSTRFRGVQYCYPVSHGDIPAVCTI